MISLELIDKYLEDNFICDRCNKKMNNDNDIYLEATDEHLHIECALPKEIEEQHRED